VKKIIIISVFLISGAIVFLSEENYEPAQKNEQRATQNKKEDSEIVWHPVQQEKKDIVTKEQQTEKKVVESEENLDDQSFEQGLATIEALRIIPGASELIDDIVYLFERDDENAFSLSNIPTDDNGLATIDRDISKHMIKDPEMRKKWNQLMDLIVAYTEAK